MATLQPILSGEPSYDWQGNIRPLSADHAEGVGAYEDGRLVGSLTWRLLPDSLHLVASFIKPEYRSQGLFQRMFSYATALHPDTPVTGDSEEGNPVRTMYDTYNYHLLRGTARLKEAGLWEDAFKQGHGAAFWYDGNQLHWGDTHYMIFHDLFNTLTPEFGDDYEKREQGIFGWVYPNGEGDEESWYGGGSPYEIDFGTDFGLGANKANPHLQSDAVYEVEHAIGYPADHVYYGKTAGHAEEPEDLENAQADGAACQNCGSMITGDLCGECGSENLSWWTENSGLQNFKGSWKEDEEYNLLVRLDNEARFGYTTKTSDWDEQFEEPVDADLGNFEQETGDLTDEEKQDKGIEGPYDVDGWKVYTRDCGDVYPTHDAIWLDRGNKVALIGWQGHHHDLFQGVDHFMQLMQNADPYNQTAGHFRTMPSDTEPFPAGWGWHGSSGTKEEKNVLKQVIKNHYKVDKLKDLYQSNDDAEENYMDTGEDELGNIAKKVKKT